jgi:hypothetical protein
MRTPKPIGYFMSVLGRINKALSEDRVSDLPRFTQVQVRLIAKYLERHDIFDFDVLRDRKDHRKDIVYQEQKRAFKKAVKKFNPRIPTSFLERFLL